MALFVFTVDHSKQLVTAWAKHLIATEIFSSKHVN